MSELPEFGSYLSLWKTLTLIKVVSDLRKQTKQRVLSQDGDEYNNANAAKVTVEKYCQHQDREYKEYQKKLTELQE